MTKLGHKIMKTLLSVAVAIGFLLADSSSQAATYFVSKSGSDVAVGSQQQPFLTVQKAVNMARAGDTVLVGPGTYAENVRTADNAGTATAPITIDGQNVATVGSFSLEKPYIRIFNFSVTGGKNLWNSMLYVAQVGSFCIVSNNVFDANFDTALSPIVRWNGPASPPFGGVGSDNLIISNVFKNVRGEMVFRINGSRNLISGNQILNLDNADYFQVAGGTNYIVNNVCSNLFFSGLYSGNHADIVQIFGNAGGTAQASVGHLVESNLVFKADKLAQLGNLTDDGYALVRDITFRNNIFIGVSAKCSCAMPEVKWYNNVFYSCATNTDNGGPLLIFSNLDPSIGRGHSGKVFNNVFVNCGVAGNLRNGNGWYSFDTGLTNVAADYNYVGKDGYKAIDTDPQHRAIGNPGGWDRLLWWEPNGINGGNPLFVNESQFDFRLQAGSPLIARALALNQLFATDMRGLTRGAQWDIGPFEFQAGEAVQLLPASNLRPAQ